MLKYICKYALVALTYAESLSNCALLFTPIAVSGGGIETDFHQYKCYCYVTNTAYYLPQITSSENSETYGCTSKTRLPSASDDNLSIKILQQSSI